MELNDIIESIDIVEYISQFVELEEKNDEYWGLSPFSEESTPSFSVRRETNTFYCFSSGVGGNIFTFTKRYFNCSSIEAVEMLKKYMGCEAGELTRRNKLPATLMCKKYVQSKKRTNHKKNTTKKYSENCMEKYEKRADKLKVWEEEGISKSTLNDFQIYYDNFSNRLVYPIRDISGQIVNIGGRALDKNWKEKGLRKYTYFSGWGEMDIIYGLYENMAEIKKQNEIIIFEGCKSVLVANSWGIKNTGALLTSHLNPRQMKILAALGARVVFALDKDVDITKDHNINRLKRFVNVDYFFDRANLLNEKDAPVDRGREVFNGLYSNKLKFR